MILSFGKIFKEICSLRVPLFYKCRLRNSKINIFNRSPMLHCSLMDSRLFNTENKLERFPLDEIRDLNTNQLNCDFVQWCEICDEILQAKAAGKNLPEYLDLNDISELLKCYSKTRRSKYLTFLFKKEKKKFNASEKRRKKREEGATVGTGNELDNGHIKYGLGNNALLLRTRTRSIHKFYDKRLANSILFGPKIVIDLGYDEFMWNKEKRDCANQVGEIYASNRQNSEPYNLHLCNAKSETQCVKYLYQLIPNIDESLITLTEQSYLDIFSKEDLVYLSPHASETLKTYDHKAIYIIGGFVDIVKRKTISLFKAQEEGIKSYSLPLDEYVLWGSGSKSLSINQAFSIMQTMRDTGDWKQAFKHVPSRKLRRLKADSDEAQCMSDKLFVMRN